MTLRWLTLLGIVSLFNQYEPVLGNECEWKVEYIGFPNAIKYYSSCNADEYLIVSMLTLQELTILGIPTANVVVFAVNGQDWSWIFEGLGEQSSFQGFDCMINEYIAKLGTIFGNNCLFNLTTYLFDEIVDIDIYNITKRIFNKYAFKWDVDIEQWPWTPLSTNNYLELCMTFRTNIGGIINSSSDEYFLNFTFGADFYVSIPKYFTCGGSINAIKNIKIIDQEITSLAYVCIEIPYCDAQIYYDPIVSTDNNINQSKSDDTLTAGQIVGIVIGVLAFIACIAGLTYYFVWRKKKLSAYTGLMEQK